VIRQEGYRYQRSINERIVIYFMVGPLLGLFCCHHAWPWVVCGRKSDRRRDKDTMSHTPFPEGSNSTLTTLAYINASWQEDRKSYLDNFVPFVLEALRVADSPVNPGEVREFVKSRFGLDLPHNVVRSLVDRGVKVRDIRRLPRSEAVELADGVGASLPDLTAQQAACQRQQRALVAKILEFADSRFRLSWSAETAEAALMDYIDLHVVPLLTSSVRGRPAPEPEEPLSGSGYVLANFIAHVFESDPTHFEYLDQMIKGSMLASALYVDSTGEVTRKFKDTTLYLDAPICLRALGHEGPEAQEATGTMLRLALAQGAHLACFEHSVKEIKGILAAARSAIARNPTAESATRGVTKYYRSIDGAPAELDLAIANLDRELERLQVAVVSTPPHVAAYTVDESALEVALQDVVGYLNPAALRVDLDSLTAVHRKRRGVNGGNLENCRAVLVTNNFNLVRVAREFFRSEGHDWAHAMMDNSLTTLLWIKKPNVTPDLPKQQIIADCYTALAPSSSLWTRFVSELERLEGRGEIDADSVAFLRYSHEAERAVMDVTYGDPQNLSGESIKDALDRARAAASAPAEAVRREAENRAKSAEASQQAATFEAERVMAENSALEARVAAMEAREKGRADRLRKRIAFGTKLVRFTLMGPATVAALASVVLGVAGFFPTVARGLPWADSFWLRAIGVACFIGGILTMLFGGSVHALVAKLEQRLVAALLKRAGLLQQVEEIGDSRTT
jgi:hypothetical protein